MGPMTATAGSMAGDCCGGAVGLGWWDLWMRERRYSPPFAGGGGKSPPPPFMEACHAGGVVCEYWS